MEQVQEMVGTGQVHTFGFNHYFNSNVRLMIAEYAYGDYTSDNSNGMRESNIFTSITSKITSKILKIPKINLLMKRRSYL